MKSRLLAGVASAAILAANCARAAEPLPPPPPPPPVFSWTGCHIGPHIGLATGRAWWQDTQPDGNIDGGVRGVLSQRTAITDTSGGIYGGQLGCDWQFPASSFVIGIEGTVDGANIEGTNQDEFNAPWTLRNKVDVFGTVTGRVGYAVPGANNVLLYFRGGVVFTDNRFEIENSGVFLGSPSASRTGWTVGAGIEWAFAPAWSLFIEGNYYDTGHVIETFDNAFAVQNAFVVPPFTINTRTTYETFKLGVNWHFWSPGVPVLAKY
jgi:outer membrane immunogenic protein